MDIDIGLAQVEKISIHSIGNKVRNEELGLSNSETQPNDQIERMILGGYLKNIIKSENKYTFHHETDLKFNEIYSFTSSIFEKTETFLENTKKIAKHLYSQISHPNITSGELITILFKDILINNQKQKAIGIFKSDVKDEYFSVLEHQKNISLEKSTGINPNQIDKGVLIFPPNYTEIFIIDRFRHKAKYWIDDFLKITKLYNSDTNHNIASKVITLLPEEFADQKSRSELEKNLKELVESAPKTSIKKIKDIACNYISSEKFSEILDKSTKNSEQEFNELTEFDNKKIIKKISSAFHKFKIIEGIELSTGNDIKIENIDLKEDSKNYLITIKAEKV